MAKGTVIQKIIDTHFISGEKQIGSEVVLTVDQTLMHDASGTMVCLELEAMNIKKIAIDLSLIYIDHNTMMIGPENRNDHIFLQSFAKKFGFHFSRHGNGICHQVHLERFGVPGKVLLGADSHTPTNGGLGMLAIGSGGLDIAQGIAGKGFKTVYPKIIGVELKGKLNPWVSAKDIILKMLSILSTKGNVGCMIEYFGDGIKQLSVPERGTITNMGAEIGVTSSIFPSDAQTLSYLKAQGREESWINIERDQDAEYDSLIKIDLDSLNPMIACPSSPDNVKEIVALANVAVDQIIIGSCTNSSYTDMATVAHILAKRQINENVTLSIAPGSKQVIETLERDGILKVFIESGAKILESACGPCAGQGQSPGEDTVSLRTFNRNFTGRSGTINDKLYLVSPAIAAASAITGKISLPSDLGIPYKKNDLPSKFVINDNMLIAPLLDDSNMQVIKKSTIKNIPPNTDCPHSIKGRVVIKVGNKITTDHIIPIGRFMKYRSNIYEYAKVVFNCYNEKNSQTFADKCLELKSNGEHNIIVGGLSYGQGSSREHAALCPMYLGVKVVIAKSIERIHCGNLINFGIIPLTFTSDEDYEKIEVYDQILIDDIIPQLNKSNLITIKCIKSNNLMINFALKHNLSERDINILNVGGVLNLKH